MIYSILLYKKWYTTPLRNEFWSCLKFFVPYTVEKLLQLFPVDSDVCFHHNMPSESWWCFYSAQIYYTHTSRFTQTQTRTYFNSLLDGLSLSRIYCHPTFASMCVLADVLAESDMFNSACLSVRLTSNFAFLWLIWLKRGRVLSRELKAHTPVLTHCIHTGTGDMWASALVLIPTCLKRQSCMAIID